MQKWIVACFGIFSVTSTWVLKHATHIFAGLGSILMPQIQHNLEINIINFILKKKIIEFIYINFIIVEVIFTYITDSCRIGSFNSIIDTYFFIFCK